MSGRTNVQLASNFQATVYQLMLRERDILRLKERIRELEQRNKQLERALSGIEYGSCKWFAPNGACNAQRPSGGLVNDGQPRREVPDYHTEQVLRQ